MAFVLCRACGNQVSPDASSCPRCGATTPAVAESGSSPATGATPSPFRKPPAPASARDAAESAPPPSSRLAPDVERKGGAPARQTRSASTRVHGMIVAGLLIILLFLWYGLANRQPAPSPTLATTSAPTSRRHLSSAQRQAANEALQALKALESVTTAGVTYTYDGDGNRVKKSSGTLYWGTGPLAESSLEGTVQAEYIGVKQEGPFKAEMYRY